MTRKRNVDDATGTHSDSSRRGFLGCLGLSPGLARLGGASLLAMLEAPSAFANLTPIDAGERGHRAYLIRRDTAIFQRDFPETPSLANGDEELYPGRIASYSKGLPHNDTGEVDLNAYNLFIQALNSGLESDFEAIPLGGSAKFGKSAGRILLQPGRR